MDEKLKEAIDLFKKYSKTINRIVALSESITREINGIKEPGVRESMLHLAIETICTDSIIPTLHVIAMLEYIKNKLSTALLNAETATNIMLSLAMQERKEKGDTNISI